MQDSWKRCPRSTCIDYGKPLRMDVGADESRGDLTVQHRCWECGYVEYGPTTPESARRTSATVAEVAARILAQRQRLTDQGVEIPLRKDVEVSRDG